MNLRQRVENEFRNRFGRSPEIIVRAPGRVNLLGAHVDYNEGWVLPAATEQAVWLAAAAADDGVVTIRAIDFDGAEATFSLEDLPPRDNAGPVSWSDYPRGVAWVLRNAGCSVRPIDVVFAGDVPIGAGVSSSAAVEVAFLTTWNAMGRLGLNALQLAQLGQQTENQYIGLASGIMDQFASVHAAENQLVLLDCRTLQHELIPLPSQTAILVADSGVRRELANSEYNVRRSQCDEAVALLKPHLPLIRTLRDVSLDDFELNAHHLPMLLRRRAQHVIQECNRVLNGAELLKRGDLTGFGRLMRQSHMSSRDLYEVSIPELDLLASTAWEVEGCYGARLTGAGFGGCVVILSEACAMDRLAEKLHDAYRAVHSQSPRIFHTRAANGARVMAS